MAAHSHAQTNYKFINLADTNGPWSEFDDSAFTINSSGTVAFAATLKTGGRGIFRTSDGQSFTRIVQTGDVLEYNTNDNRTVTRIGRAGAIDSLGRVAFSAYFEDLIEGVYLGDGGKPARVVTNKYHALTSPGINAEGKASWSGFFGLRTGTGNFDSSRYYVLRTPVGDESGADGSAGAIIAHTGGADEFGDNITGFFSGFGPTSINDEGSVAFRADIRSGGAGIFVGRDALPSRFGRGEANTTRVADTVSAGSPFDNFGNPEYRPDINNSRTVVFGANLKNGLHGIYKGTPGGVPTTVVENTGPFSRILLTPAINSAGTVLFGAERTNGRGGFYKGADPVKDVVVETGAALFGSTLAGGGSGPRTINDEGKIVFTYRLADGRTGLALAIPNGEKKPTGDLTIKESTEPDSAFAIPGFYNSAPQGGQYRESTFAPQKGIQKIFDVELTNNKTEEETYVLHGVDSGTEGWTVEALFGTTDNWPAIRSTGASLKLAPGAKRRFQMRVKAADSSKIMPSGFKREFTLSVRALSDEAFYHDAVGAKLEVKLEIEVNTTGDESDADSTDEVPDVDLKKDGLQITLRSALEFTNSRGGGDVIKFKVPAGDPGMVNGVAVIRPKKALPEVDKTVTIDGSTQNPGSFTPTVQLDGMDLPGVGGGSSDPEGSLESQYDFITNASGMASGLVLNAAGCKVRGLALVHFPFSGVEIKGAKNAIQGCHIGIDAKGVTGAANGISDRGANFGERRNSIRGAGVLVRSSQNQIGGNAAGEENLIAGTSGAVSRNDPGIFQDTMPPGIIITGGAAFGNIISGNRFSLNATGVGFPQTGIDSLPVTYCIADVVVHNARANLIGGTTNAAGNVFAGPGTGVLLVGESATSNLVIGNEFGPGGSESELAKGQAVSVVNGRSNQIGGFGAGEANRINGGSAVQFTGAATSNQVLGNQITESYGIEFGPTRFASNGSAPSGNLIEGNRMSVYFRGVDVFKGSNITIKGNAITGHRSSGVRVVEGDRIRIVENEISGSGNRSLGISFGVGEGGPGASREKPNLNDFDDFDGGPNQMQNFPVLGNAITDGSRIEVEGSLSTNSGSRQYQIDVFSNSAASATGYGQGQRYLGSVTATTSFAGQANFTFVGLDLSVPPGEFISATATDPDGNTSEFSKVVKAYSRNDQDRDGVNDEEERRVPNRRGGAAQSRRATATSKGAVNNSGGTTLSDVDPAGFGDGNADGVADADQANVASFVTIAGKWVTLASPPGTTLVNVGLSGPPEFDNQPASSLFPVGFVNFTVAGIAPGGSVDVAYIFHDTIRYATVFAYGPHDGSTEASWYEFLHDGATGATFRPSELLLHFVDNRRGDHDLQTNGQVTTLLAPAALTTGQLLNISTRLRVQTGENVLIGGVIVTGTDPKRVLLRAVGPSLAGFVNGALPDPFLELYQGGNLVARNDNWQESQREEIEGTTVPPAHELESAMVQTLAPGFYTAVMSGTNGVTGVGVIEAYDLDQAANSELANISSRGLVEGGDNVMIGGLIVGGSGSPDTRVLVRAIGPSLASAGIAGLPDPTLELVDGNGNVAGANDDWQDSQRGEIEATTIPPTHPTESAIVTTLPPGNYTAVVRGVNGATGVGVVEVYNLQ